MSSVSQLSDGKSGKYIVMDIVFYASSLNYDQGGSNLQELKKITKWNGKQYVLVSRYALRYSILHLAHKLFGWKLAGPQEFIHEKDSVPHPKRELIKEKKILEYPEFDLFGFMIAEKGSNQEDSNKKEKKKEEVRPLSRTSPVKISHAVSLTPYNYDSHFSANLDIMKRSYGTSGYGSNPVIIEEKQDFYAYNVVIDVDRVGVLTKEELGSEANENIEIKSEEKTERILQLIETIFKLKREIKGRVEDLSPWLMIVGLYNNAKYDTYLDKISLATSHTYKIISKIKTSKDDNGNEVKEIENQIIARNDVPKFLIYFGDNVPTESVNNFDTLKDKIREFLNDSSKSEKQSNGATSTSIEKTGGGKSEEQAKVYVFRCRMIEVEEMKEVKQV